MTPAARAGELLAFAEAELAAGRVGTAADAIYGVANTLAEDSDQPALLGRALWLIGVISLLDGDLVAFTEHANAAIESFELGADAGAAALARRTMGEIVHRVGLEVAVREHGAAGFIEALVRCAERLLARERGELDWADTDRDRDQMAALLTSAPGPLPLLRLITALELDSVEATMMLLLIPLAAVPAIAAEARRLGDGAEVGGDATAGLSAAGFARLLFERVSAREAVISRLAPGLPLRRYHLVRISGGGAASEQRIELEPELLWYLRDAPLTEWPWPEGVVVAALPEASVATSLAPVRDGLARLLDQPHGGVAIVQATTGAGKTTVAIGAASAVGRPTLVIDADALSDAGFEVAVSAVVRNAFLVGAAVYVRCERRVPPLARLLEERSLRLVLGTTRALAPDLLEAVRRVRADIAPFELEPLPLEAQVEAWRRACAELGVEAPPAATLEPVCRAELYPGDIVDTATEACTRATADGVAVSAALLARVLDARLEARLAAIVPVVSRDDLRASALRAADPGEQRWLDAAATRLATPVTEVADWGAVASAPTRRARIVLQLPGGSAVRRRALARMLAAQVGAPLAILTLSDEPDFRARAHLVAAVAAAARARAVLLIEDAGGLRGPVAELLERELERTTAAAVVSCEGALPLALTALASAALDAAVTPEAR